MRRQRSAEATAYRPLYQTARWQRLRRIHLDGEPLCRMCSAQGRITEATVVDHIEPHKGDEARFFDLGNLQSLCKPHHDGAKQQEERRGYSTMVGLDGWPVDARHPVNKSDHAVKA